ncbi:MAG TPA: glycosyl hydrolase-related protein [Clostridia bacterium]|nr:glycosyl hydrolase-related protein [Clostridia bacterium]
MQQNYRIVSVHHVDLAYLKGFAENHEMLETAVVRILDALDTHPEYTYTLEQAYHYRALARRRPDLIRRIRAHIQAGRLEMAGGMISTLETNLPCGESFVRNLVLGARWVEENLGQPIRTGWLVDTFGINAQVPQLMRQFGLAHLFASRFGGRVFDDTFFARGIDGSRVLVMGRNCMSDFVRPGHLSRDFCKDWRDHKALFDYAKTLRGEGPRMVMPYTENETLISLYPIELARSLNDAGDQGQWRFCLLSEYLRELDAFGCDLPELDADLNAEFTGTYAYRPLLRVENRRAETALLEAEKWQALLGLGRNPALEEAWWVMARNQFHDVISGSHPLSVYRDAMERFAGVLDTAHAALRQGLIVAGEDEARGDGRFCVLNGLPWARRDVVEIPLQPGEQVARVQCEDHDLPFALRDGRLLALVDMPAVGCRELRIERGPSPEPPAAECASGAVLENAWLRMEFDTRYGVRRMWRKENNALLMRDAGDLLLAQQDDGSLQFEQPVGSDVPLWAGTIHTCAKGQTPLGEYVTLTGAFPPMDWAGAESALSWQVTFDLPRDAPRVDVAVHFDWKGGATRVRLRVPTPLDTAGGLYEIPFGTVLRKPYGIARTAKGEWPAQRFVAVQDSVNGLALINTGAAGVEVVSGAITTTLIRTPRHAWGEGFNDDVSRQQGTHEFRFALVPYGAEDPSVVWQMAQQVNNSLRAFSGCAVIPSGCPLLELSTPQVVLSSVKPADDDSGEIVVRLYETAGKPCEASLRVAGVHAAWRSDIRERRLDVQPVADGATALSLHPFEILTLRLAVHAGSRSAQSGNREEAP